MGKTTSNSAINGTESADTITGTSGNDTIYGLGGNDSIYGLAGSDFIVGGDGDDFLDGGSEHDHLDGGAGNDTFVVDNALDTVIERTDGGIDRVISSVDYTLHLELEHLTLAGTAVTGTGNYRNNEILGNASNNVLDGREGDDIIVGGAGSDSLTGGLGNDRLYSDAASPNVLTPQSSDTLAQSDTLSGGAGDDRLFAGYGDTVDGGADRDSLYINFQGASAGVHADFRELIRTGSVTIGGATLSNIEFVGSIVGSQFNDFLAVGISTLHGAVYGMGGDDHIIAASSTANIYGGDGNDYIDARSNRETAQHYGDAGNDTMIGGYSDDVFHGGDGNDWLDGGEFVDFLYGGAGDDTYVVDVGGTHADDLARDRVIEAEGEGTDTVRSSVTFWLSANVENLTLTGSAVINGTGNGLNNALVGNAAANQLSGAAGNDTLDGGLGNDTLTGGEGVDTFKFKFGDGQDTITDLTAGEIVQVSGYTAAQSITQSGTNVIVVFSGTDQITFHNATVSSVQAALRFPGSTIDGTSGNDTLNGTSGNDTINGFAGNDALNGRAGADTLIGGIGNDSYYVDDSGDVVVEQPGEGTEWVYSIVSHTLAANVEHLTLTGTAATNGTGNDLANTIIGNSAANVLTGAAGNDTLNGGAGADTFIGGSGNDSYYLDDSGDVVVEQAAEGADWVYSTVSHALAANVENLTLTGTAATSGTGNELSNTLIGNEAANVLIGGAGNDALNGATGADTLIGGTGNDSYYVDNVDDVVTEQAGEGIDWVYAIISHALAANLEKLTLTGTAAIDGTGNDLANTIIGNSAANVLTGGGGDDAMNGGAGSDTLVGGTGNDSYYINDTGDVVIEAAGEGTEWVYASVSHTLAANVEHVTLTGTAAIGGTGNELANAINGNGAANVLIGGAGDDFLNGAAGNDTLEGGTGGDVLTGGTGADRFVFRDGDSGSNGSASDLLTDFSQAQGDQMDLSAIDANALVADDQAFQFIGTGSFTGTAGELRFEVVSGSTYVSGDTNGDGIADFTVQLAGSHALTGTDFII